MNRSIIMLLTATVMIGCLKTRAELEAQETGHQLQKQTNSQQQQVVAASSSKPQATHMAAQTVKPAISADRSEEIDEQMRALSGRIEANENLIQRMQAAEQQKKEAWIQDKQMEDRKLQAYEDAIRKLEAQVQALNDEVTKLKETPPPPEPQAAPKSATKKGKSSGPYEAGEDHFGAKKWKDAIVSFQKYRDQNPKGKNYADATYKIGVCFQELGMKDEAKSFMEEVTAKFPNSKEAKKAAFRLKNLK